MKTLISASLVSVFSIAPLAFTDVLASNHETRIIQMDSIGTPLADKPQWIIQKDGRVLQTDSIGTPQNDKPQFKIIDNKVYETDSIGTIKQHKPAKAIK